MLQRFFTGVLLFFFAIAACAAVRAKPRPRPRLRPRSNSRSALSSRTILPYPPTFALNY